ncbi:unnamed protein product [Alopecurus aequalis]
MEHQTITLQSELGCMLLNETAQPKALSLSLLKDITKSFSDDNKIGSGGFAVVYKGMLDSGTVAVKKLFETLDIHEKKFSEEIRCLMKAKHKNIVRFLGYCCDTQGEMVDYEGELVLADVRQRLLCFEYLPQGSLDKKITDASCGLEWRKRYQIIIGICEGLYYLHQKHILHLDLKPANILLDDNMVPKIADFGISRFFDEKQSGVTTTSMIGTVGYLAPEFYGSRKITCKLDIYSLGIIIIDILTGEKGHPDIDNVLDRWRNRLEKSEGDKQLEQLRVCIDIAIQCTDFNPVKRPDIKHVLGRLGAVESVHDFTTETGAIISSTIVQGTVPLSGPRIVLENTMANDVKEACFSVPPPPLPPNFAVPIDLSRSTKRSHLIVDVRSTKRSHTFSKGEDTEAKLVKKSIQELYNIANQDHPISSALDNNSSVQQGTDIRETTSDVEEALIIGRTEDKHKTIATLSESITPEFTVLPIYGIGGIGKTTLAQLVFNDSQFSDYSRVWVYVSQNLDLHKIGNSIISQLSEETHIAEKQIIHNRLRKILAGKKILIVLDDVWENNPDTLETLKAMLRLGAGSMVTIIVTTRDEAIAREICHTVEPYKLDTFSDKVCWKIIKQKTSFKDRVDKKQLKHIGREIATKCGGVALAAQSLGYMLKHMRYSDEWESVRDSYIWNLSTSEGTSSRSHEVLASLLLSYSHMPDWLKLCFSYCAVFPKGHLISKYDLIHQWIALQFIGPSRIFDSMQLCEKYITQLLGMSFLQYAKTSSRDRRLDNYVPLLTMHDLVHDLATAILADQLNNKGNFYGNICHYASLTDCSKPLQLAVTSPASLKALRFMGCGKLELCGDAYSLAMCLRVLDLSECFIQKLPDTVGQLKQLRFLCAPRIHDQMIPDFITKLSELNYLNLSGSSISALPESIGDLKGLMHLDLSDCGAIRKLPMSFAELKQLVHLNLSGCKLYISEALGGFTKLQYLNLSANNNIHWDRGRRTEVIGNLIKLRYLNLSSSDIVQSLVGSISTLSNLEHLDLSANYGLSSIPESMCNLRKLQTLDLSGCHKLRNLPNSMANMVSLKILNVDSRVRFDESVHSTLNFASLPYFVVHASMDRCNSNIISLQPTNPFKLTIDRLENVKSAEEARSIKLKEKENIEWLTFQWTLAAERFVDDKEVLEKLVPPRSVTNLSITGYRSVGIPNWLMGTSQYVPNLVEMHLCDFPNCSNLPPLDQLPNLRVLSLFRMKGLEEWNMRCSGGEEGENELLFPKLKLTIKHCAKLRIKPCLPARVAFFEIEDCDNVISSRGEGSSHSGDFSSSPLTILIVEKIKVPLHQWRLLHQLPALRSLSISDCSDLATSPEIIQHLPSLSSLTLKHNYHAELPNWLFELTSLEALILWECRGITSLPQCLGKLTSLEVFEISYCEGITSLPDSIQQLTNLERLYIRGCPTLKEWCESEENDTKLAHIKIRNTRPVTFLEPASNSAASIHGTDEVHPDLYSVVMNMPGFDEEALLVAVSHLMDNVAQGSAYMGMQEEDRVSWLMNFLKRHY